MKHGNYFSYEEVLVFLNKQLISVAGLEKFEPIKVSIHSMMARLHCMIFSGDDRKYPTEKL